MSVIRTFRNNSAISTTLDLLNELFNNDATRKVGIRLWDGTCWPDDAPRPAVIVLNHPGALRKMFLPRTQVGRAEAYLYDDFNIEGDIESFIELTESLAPLAADFAKRLYLGWNLLRLPREASPISGRRGPARLQGEHHSIERDRQAIAYHYDVSNDFYALWLDQRMVYSCAYFLSSEDSLDQAQEHKLEHICRKLRLRPGQRLVDLGCGWGGLVIYAAEHYGVEALGITLSQPQADLANQRIAQAGLKDRCRVKMLDYRELDEAQGYDAIASVGMFEHVGKARLEAYFQQAWMLLRPGGLFLNHGITRNATVPVHPERTFSDAYVFPDSEVLPISKSLLISEKVGFEVRDVESLREHYAMTLRYWVRRLEANHEQALRFVDEPTYRVWRFFMSFTAYYFTTGRYNVHQALLVKPGLGGQSGLPLTRADLYTV